MNAVDLFAGAGGFTAGALAAGVRVLWAANHWKLAVDIHALNHPGTEHVCQDLFLFPPDEIPTHDLLLASPSCKGNSPARGKERPHHDKYRATAWIVIDALEAKQPPFAIIENVPGMLKWPLYPAWKEAIRLLGYSMAEHIVDAADCGVPQNRVRVFFVLARSEKPLFLKLQKQKHVPVSSVLNWEGGRWGCVFGTRKRPRAKKTLARIGRAMDSGLLGRFLIPYYGSGSGLTGRSQDRPVGTLTTRARWALVDMDRELLRMMSVQEARACMGFPVTYVLPQTIKDGNIVLGNAVCPPVATQLVTELQRRC